MAIFSSKPYLLVNWVHHETSHEQARSYYRGIIWEDGFYRFPFASTVQRLSIHRETPELLSGEFARMWQVVRGQERHGPDEALAPEFTAR
jgi:hypothetical protein